MKYRTVSTDLPAPSLRELPALPAELPALSVRALLAPKDICDLLEPVTIADLPEPAAELPAPVSRLRQSAIARTACVEAEVPQRTRLYLDYRDLERVIVRVGLRTRHVIAIAITAFGAGLLAGLAL